MQSEALELAEWLVGLDLEDREDLRRANEAAALLRSLDTERTSLQREYDEIRELLHDERASRATAEARVAELEEVIASADKQIGQWVNGEKHEALQDMIGDLLRADVAQKARVVELERERDEARGREIYHTARHVENALKLYDQATARATTAEASVKELVEGLEFYADTSNYPAPLTGGMGALWHDCGSVARALIAKHKDTSNG